MELKQYNIEPTDENILKSMRENTAGRNAALAPFWSLSTMILCPRWP